MLHKKYGGSGAHRDIGCAANHTLSKDIPESVNGPNPAADRGSMLHDAMEKIYGAPPTEEINPSDLLKAALHYNEEYLNQDLIDTKLDPAIDTVEDLFDDLDIEDWMVEPYVDIDDDMGGSIDLLAWSADKKTVLVLDYKFGFHTVNVVDNKQLQFYALAASISPNTQHLFDEVETIVLAIVQPNDEGEILSRWDITLDQLDKFETEYFNAVEKTLDPDAQPTAGTWCKYCPAHATCPVKTGLALKATRVNEITADKLAEYLPMAEEVTAWAKEVNKMAHAQLELGTPIDGYKLVAKRASRIWNDPEAVGEKIKKAKKIKLSQGFDIKLKSPAQLEKECKKLGVDFEKYEPYISSVSSGSTLAKQSDKRTGLLPIQGLEQLNAMND